MIETIFPNVNICSLQVKGEQFHAYVYFTASVFFLRDFFSFLALFPSITELLRPLEYALFGNIHVVYVRKQLRKSFIKY